MNLREATKQLLSGFTSLLMAALGLALAWPLSAQEADWTTAADMNLSRVVHGACSVEDKVYVFGGQREGGGEGIVSVEEYDPDSESWTPRSDMPTPRLGMAVSSVHGKCYLMGGAERPNGTGLALVEEYDPDTDSWQRRADMPTARAGAASAVSNGLIYVFGGWPIGNITSQALDTVEVYDPSVDSWSELKEMPTPRAFLAAAASGDRIFALGGGSAALGTFDSAIVEAFDPGANRWEQVADLPTGRGALTAATLGDVILAMGGGFDSSPVSTVEAYDPSTDNWSDYPAMPTARWGAASAVLGNSVYVLGGSTELGVGHDSLATNEQLSLPGFRINAGLNDAWFNPDTNGQGFFYHRLPGYTFGVPGLVHLRGGRRSPGPGPRPVARPADAGRVG